MDTSIKLVRIRTRHLMNEVHFRFHFENESIYTKYNPALLGIGEFMDAFRKALNDEDVALECIRKSAATARIADADSRFDASFASMAKYAQSFLLHFDAETRRAAENLDVVFHQFGNIARQPYRQELASSYNFVQELRKRPDDVARLNLDPWIAEHESAAQALAAMLEGRTGETAQQTDLRTIDVRAEIDSIYLKITDRIDAMININGSNFVPGFVAEYNAHAIEYRNSLAQHLGRIRKNSSENDEQNLIEN